MPRTPAHNPLRRNARVGPVLLPAEGRTGDPPPWPMDEHDPIGTTCREWQMWSELWATPQAVMWEKLGWTRVVARYVRFALAAEAMDKHCYQQALLLEDRLGLTPKSMRLLLWQIAEDETPEKHDEPAQENIAANNRRRLKAVG